MRYLWVGLILAFSVFAAAEAVSVKVSEIAPVAGDLDKEVTDIKLRANSGAKTKFSSSFFLTYAGASLHKPLGDHRPNVGDQPNPFPVNVVGSFGLRYRTDRNSSVFVAGGLYRPRPFHAHQTGDKVEVDTPQISYNRTWALRRWQMSSDYRLYITTLEQSRDIGELGTFGYTLNALNSFGATRLSGGIGLILRVTGYDKHDETLEPMQTDYGGSLTPSLQYNVNDRLNFYTALNVSNYSHFRTGDFMKMRTTQTLGMGLAVFRDFYLAPYLEFEPRNIRSDNTAVNIMTSINL